MSTHEYNCPSCGAPLSVENRFSKVVICQYCGQTCQVSSSGLDPSGSKSELLDFDSVFSLGATGKIQGKAFRTLGRLRYRYDGGFWDEWFLQLDNGKKIWLQEDEGEFTAYEKESLTSPVAAFEQIYVGSMIQVNDKPFFVTEKSEAVIAGGAGELFFKITPGMKAHCVDGNCQGQLMSIEFTPDELCLSIGKEIDLDDIEFDQ